MMSTLVLVLATTMTVPANGPGMVSAEMEQSQGLDVSGSWEGIAWSDDTIWRAEVSNRTLVLTAVFGKETSRDSKAFGVDREEVGELQDRGEGKLVSVKCLTPLDRYVYEGIYKWDGDRLIICFRHAEYGRPTSFQASQQQWLLILHRVRPHK